MDKRTRKRWEREHNKRTSPKPPATPATHIQHTAPGGVRSDTVSDFAGPGDDVEIVYRPKTDEERRRRVDRCNQLVGTPFLSLPPGVTDYKAIVFTATDGTPIKAEDVEMVFNDALLMDAISNWGEDGPLYKDTLDKPVMKEVYEWALTAYKGVELPPQLRPPEK